VNKRHDGWNQVRRWGVQGSMRAVTQWDRRMLRAHEPARGEQGHVIWRRCRN